MFAHDEASAPADNRPTDTSGSVSGSLNSGAGTMALRASR
jgi:hypothetical protein